MTSNRLSIDINAFSADIDNLRAQLKQDIGAKDLAHFRKIEMVVWALFALGLGTAWMGANLIAIAALAGAGFGRWTMIAHHVSHRGYENIAGAPYRYQSKTFARGWRRLIHWLDWVQPEAWHYEHDVLHHYNLGEGADPDVPQDISEWMRGSGLPMPLRVLFVAVVALIWKPFYYAPNTLNALLNKQENTDYPFASRELWSPFRKRFWQVMWHCWLPYGVLRFAALPALFLVISAEASVNVLINLLIAELVISVWTYFVIVPNHAGSDIYVFNEHPADRGNFYLHQIVGSVDYQCGGQIRDFMQGYLNYQIEHHLFPELTLRQYHQSHRQLRKICTKHGVPVVSESIFKRMVKLIKLLTGVESQPYWPGIIDIGNQTQLVPQQAASAA